MECLVIGPVEIIVVVGNGIPAHVLQLGYSQPHLVHIGVHLHPHLVGDGAATVDVHATVLGVPRRMGMHTSRQAARLYQLPLHGAHIQLPDIR